MATNKLQELTEQLYNQGLAKGQAEGERILEEAKAKAEAILNDARQSAEKIISDASKQASDIAAKSASDIKMASFQAIEATKNDILRAISAKVVEKPVEEVLGNEEFTKKLILTIAEKYSAENGGDLNIVLGKDSKLQSYVEKEVSAAIGSGIDVQLSKNITGGLHIGPKDGSYFISFSEETFKELICAYLRPVTRKTLFGE